MSKCRAVDVPIRQGRYDSRPDADHDNAVIASLLNLNVDVITATVWNVTVSVVDGGIQRTRSPVRHILLVRVGVLHSLRAPAIDEQTGASARPSGSGVTLVTSNASTEIMHCPDRDSLRSLTNHDAARFALPHDSCRLPGQLFSGAELLQPSISGVTG